ncbi:MAG: hypothetical protein PWP31_2030 [Clostridia bacterium]|nr:hypothetical protein [Clostridia bacterium]
MNLKAVASKLMLTFGNKAPNSQINIETGASDIELFIPENIETKIRLDTTLSEDNLLEAGFVYQGDFYVTPNYETAKSKLNIDFEAGVNHLKVTRKSYKETI